ncbi:MAG: hypothetical protein R3Y22_01340 [Bacteroidales bacterium]
MGRVKVNIESWERSGVFSYFIRMEDPIVTTTSEVVVDHAMAMAKERGDSFFIYYSYAIIHALN